MKRTINTILLLVMLVATGCSSISRLDEIGHEEKVVGFSDSHLNAQAVHLEARARLKRNEAARAQRKSRRIGIGTPLSQMKPAQKAQISREKRKARSALVDARRLERQARNLRREARQLHSLK